MFRRAGRSIVATLVLALGLAACGEEAPAGAPEDDGTGLGEGGDGDMPVLVARTLLGRATAAQIAARHPEVTEATPWIVQDVSTWSFTYRTTTPDGTDATASAAAYVPEAVPGPGRASLPGDPAAPSPLPILLTFHGTLFPSEEPYAPSHDHPGNFETWFTAPVMASAGYLVAAPDYLGYGATEALDHPYEHTASQATAGVDALRALLELADTLGVATTAQLFLTGYSEGATAALATHRALDALAEPPLAVAATVALAGAYHKTAMAESLLSASADLPNVPAAIWTLLTYDALHGLNRPAASYFTEPWATALAADPFATVPANPAVLFAASFRSGVLDGTDTEFRAALAANDLHDWLPSAPVHLLHGTADVTVPYFNSLHAHAAMLARGADVELVSLTGLDHAATETAQPARVLEVLADLRSP